MSLEVIQIKPPGALDRLGRALLDYGRVSGRTSEAVLAKKGEDLAMRQPGGNSLHALFKAQAQRHGTITAAAQLRGFRLGRRRFGGSGVTRGLSETAVERATKLMSVYLRPHSILATVSVQDGRITLRGVRQGTRGKRILGGRFGRGGWAVGGDNTALRQPGDKRLNFRAVATIMEINLREAGRKFLATGFLFRRFARIQKERVLREVNPRASISIQSEAALEGQTAGGDITLRLTSHIPGTFEIGTARGLFARALHFMTADLEDYLARKQRETLRAQIRRAVA